MEQCQQVDTGEPMHNQVVSLLITVPVYGQHDLTHALVQDLEREGAEYLILDNGGDYPALGNERIVRPGRNLGWAGGVTAGSESRSPKAIPTR